MMIPTTNAVVRTRPIDLRSKKLVYNVPCVLEGATTRNTSNA
jgi:hypothetical protein